MSEPLLAPVEIDNSVLMVYIGHLLGVGVTLCLHGLHIASGLALFWSGPRARSLLHRLHDFLRHDYNGMLRT